MTKHIFAYGATLATFVTIDLVWLMWLARPTYVAEMGSLLKKEPQLAAAVAFYVLYAAGLVFFAVSPGIKAGSATHALFLGAALGLVAYGTYDLTNLSVVEGFNLRIAMIDLVWGTVLSGASAAIAVWVYSRIFG
ncbi:MAG: DUF2177 family protein [Aestuariivirga sp.]